MAKLSLSTLTFVGSTALANLSPAVANEQELNLQYVQSLMGPVMTEQKKSPNKKVDITTISTQEIENHGLTDCEMLPTKSDIESGEDDTELTESQIEEIRAVQKLYYLELGNDDSNILDLAKEDVDNFLKNYGINPTNTK